MLISEVIKVLDAEILIGDVELEIDIKGGCGADLMSDFMAFAKENELLLTGLVNPQVIRVAEMMDVKVIVFVRGKIPTNEVLELAKEMGMTILATREPMFNTCGLLYAAGLRGRGA